MNCILSSRFMVTISKEQHCALQVHLANRWQTFSRFARCFFTKVLLPVPDMYEMKELEDSPDNQTFASISQRISSGIPWFINNLNLAHLARKIFAIAFGDKAGKYFFNFSRVVFIFKWELEKRCKERRKSKELHKYIHRYQLLWETERTDLRVTEYRYLSFDRGERD